MTATLPNPRPVSVGAASDAPHPAQARRGQVELAVLGVLLIGSAVLYLWDLGSAGWVNGYYSSAVQAMSQNWTAFLFGSFDAGNAITVDKPPASLWVMALSARIFGFSTLSMLLPQALMGVGCVALLYATVRRVCGPVAGLVAGGLLAITPVAVMIFRYNNPDVLLVLAMIAAAYGTVRAVERGSTRWIVLAGVFIGIAFLTKMAQGLLVLPGLALAFVIAAPGSIWRRLGQLLAAAAAIVVSAGWWFALVELWPASDRPWIGGSPVNSAVELATGYNGLGRIFGMQSAAGAAGAAVTGPTGFTAGGEAGLLRMFNTEVGGQTSWLLPAALVLLPVVLWSTRRAPRNDPLRASLVVWGGWTLVTALVFSLMSGMHEYYTVALTPGIAALAGIGGWYLWQRRDVLGARAVLAAVTAGTGMWSWVLLSRSPEFLPWLRWVVLPVAAVAGILLLWRPSGRRVAVVATVATLVTAMAGSAAFAVYTAASTYTGGIPVAGPSTGVAGPGGGALPGGSDEADPELAELLGQAGTRWAAATVGSQVAAPLSLSTGEPVMAIGGFLGSDPSPTLEQFQAHVSAGEIAYFVPVDPSALLEQIPEDMRDDPQFAELVDLLESGQVPAVGGAADTDTTGSDITTWVEATFTPLTLDVRTIYDLRVPSPAGGP